ncbi:DUF7388 family protein [Methanococcus voltae]|uniref:Uncharacterized protein n=1 Tax=Methanococcus voltae TaxID=2188 RepID=A0A8J7UQB9_METVO|nr:hypothetical protein [Methanococcus voltae]MBP2172346.1 hypothetical protein [Methanococcus voltae]MBP2200698.1 hypothetical protein [Methanococcus voltae]
MIGIATKLSKFDYDTDKLINLNKLITKNFDIHVIDAEEIQLTDKNVLEQLNKNSQLTIQCRRENAKDLLNLYSSYNFHICFVYGNKKYMAKSEKDNSKSSVLSLLNEATKMMDNNKIWIGTEGIENLLVSNDTNIEKIVNNSIKYYVYGCKKSNNEYKTLYDKRTAVYIPFMENIANELVDSMDNYLKRRENYVGDWENYLLNIDNTSNANSNSKNKDLIDEYNNKNKDFSVIGYPINQDYSIENLKLFKNYFKK